MKNLLFAIAAFLLFAGSEATAQVSVAAACSTQTLPTGYNNGTLIIQQNGDLCTNASGGGGGGASSTASAAALPVAAGTNKPQNIDLFSQTRVLIGDETGDPIDWSADVPIINGATPLSVTVGTALPTGANVIGGVTQSGTWNVNNISGTVSLPTGASTSANQAALIGSKAPGTAAASSLLTGGVFTSGGVTLTDTQQAALSLDSSGRLIVSAVGNGNYTVVQTTPAQLTPLVYGSGTTAAPTCTTGTNCPMSLDTSGGLRISPTNGAGVTLNFVGTNSDALATISGLSGQTTNSVVRLFNGSTFDRARGNTVGMAVIPNGLRASRWSYPAAASGISNTTTAVTIKAAAGAGFRNCLTSVDYTTDALGAAGELAVRDGAGGPVLWRTKLQMSVVMPHVAIPFPAAICGSDNTLLEVVTLTASGTGAVYFNANGNIAP